MNDLHPDDIQDLRSANRYIISYPLTGGFGASEIRIIDFSTAGIQVQHDEPLRLGLQARISFAVSVTQRISWRGTVVWSHIAKKADDRGKHPYCSGIRIDEEPADVEPVLRELIAAGKATVDSESLERKKQALREKAKARAERMAMKVVVQKNADITTDQLLMITHARERLQSNPEEARKWYLRAKFALSDDQSRVGSSAGPMHYREDVLAVWEYLERTIELEKILRVFEEQRK